MNKNQWKVCLSITRKLKRHPASGPFRVPADASKPELANYYEIIDDPQDLQTIEARLKSKDYRSVREWKRDINTMLENTIIFAGANSFSAVLSQCLSKVFEKELKTLSYTNINGWMNRVSELQNELNAKLANPPSSLSDTVPSDMKQRQNYKPLTATEFNALFLATSSLPEATDRETLVKMLGEPKNSIALTNLPLSDLHKAQDFVKEKMPDVRRTSRLTV